VLGQAQQEGPEGEQTHGAEESLGYQSSHSGCFTIRPGLPTHCTGQRRCYEAPHTTKGLSVIVCPDPSTPVTCATNRQAVDDTGTDERNDTLALDPPVVATVAPPLKMTVWAGQEVVVVSTDPTGGFAPVCMSAPATT
jgi:hypothetical protein